MISCPPVTRISGIPHYAKIALVGLYCMSQWNSALRDFEEFHCSGIQHNAVLRNSALVEFCVMQNRVTLGLGVHLIDHF